MTDFFVSPAPTYQDISPEQFSAGMRQPDAVLVDVRRHDEFVQGHLPQARNLDVSAPDFSRRIEGLDAYRPVYVYCRSGARSATAARQLSQAGFKQVYNLAGGILGWAAPLVR